MNYLRISLRCAGIIAVMLALTTYLGNRPHDVVPGTLALAYLTVILLVAAVWHFRMALFASATSILCFAYFLPPAHSFAISGARHWIILFAFSGTAVTASLLSNRIQTEAAAANRRREEMERLYSLSQQMLKVGNVADLLQSIPRSIAISFHLASVVLYVAEENRIYSSDLSDNAAAPPLPIEELRDAMQKPITQLNDPACTLLPLAAGLRPIGLLVLAGGMPAHETLETLASLVTMGIIRVSAMEDVASAKASRESEWLRTVLIDSATRGMRFPLLEIETAAKALVSQPADAAQLQTAASAILANTENLQHLITQVVNMAQQQPADMSLHQRPCSMSDLIEEVLASREALTRNHPVKLDLLERTHHVMMDPGWIAQVLGYLLDNAAKYSSPGQPIDVDSEARGNKLLVSVIDRGIGIEPSEHSLIFQRFYRGSRQPEMSTGAGLGLPIARAIVEAHGGTLEVSSRPGAGSAFTFSLPLVVD